MLASVYPMAKWYRLHDPGLWQPGTLGEKCNRQSNKQQRHWNAGEKSSLHAGLTRVL